MLVRTSVVWLSTLAFSGPALQAQTVLNPTFTATLEISGGPTPRTANLGPWLVFDPATGALRLPDRGTTLGDRWAWTPDTINPATGQAGLAMTWNSPDVGLDGAPATTVSFFKAGGNVDPFLTYAYAVKNNTGVTQSYTFTFGESLIPPIAGPYSLYADIAAGLTNANVGSTAAIAPTVSDAMGDNDGVAEIQTLWLSPDGGITLINAGADVGPGFTTMATTSVYGPYSSSLLGTGMFNYWEIQARFTLSPNQDAVGFAGFAEIVPIPEPTLIPVAAGVAALAVAFVRRRRKPPGGLEHG